MKYYISDLHLFHEAAIRFDNRPFHDLCEMHRTIAERFIYMVIHIMVRKMSIIRNVFQK